MAYSSCDVTKTKVADIQKFNDRLLYIVFESLSNETS